MGLFARAWAADRCGRAPRWSGSFAGWTAR
jgi:hypothetical protein